MSTNDETVAKAFQLLTTKMQRQSVAFTWAPEVQNLVELLQMAIKSKLPTIAVHHLRAAAEQASLPIPTPVQIGFILGSGGLGFPHSGKRNRRGIVYELPTSPIPTAKLREIFAGYKATNP